MFENHSDHFLLLPEAKSCTTTQALVHPHPSESILQNLIEKIYLLSCVTVKRIESDTPLFDHSINAVEKNIFKCKINTKISNSKITMADMHSSIKKLKILRKTLERNDFCFNQENKKKNSCESLKNEINISSQKLKNSAVQCFKNKLKKRNNVRKKTREEKQKWILRKNNVITRRNQLDINIDIWMKEKKDKMIRQKEKIILCKDADIVLSEVRTKRTDARKFLIMLQELENLRKVKVAILRGRGEITPLQADTFFNNIIAKLLQQWTVLDKEYLLEEQGLKLMVTDSEQNISRSSLSIFSDWETIILGHQKFLEDWFQQNLIKLTKFRLLWDQCTSTTKISRIPVGWVIPDGPSSFAWMKNNTKKSSLISINALYGIK